MATNWAELNDKYNKFKPYAVDGKYKVKPVSVEIKEVGSNGSVIMKFAFEETDVKFPTVDQWLSFKNENWRKWHNRCLLIALGLTEEQAENTVDLCEKSGKKETIIKDYNTWFNKAIDQFEGEIEIKVTTDENDYARAEFADPTIAGPKNKDEVKKPEGDVLPSDDEVTGEEITLDGVPF